MKNSYKSTEKEDKIDSSQKRLIQIASKLYEKLLNLIGSQGNANKSTINIITHPPD